jgi:hypothetical protein
VEDGHSCPSIEKLRERVCGGRTFLSVHCKYHGAGWKTRPPLFTYHEPTRHFFNPYEPIDKHFHRLPHWQQVGAIYFATWRLDDSLPRCKLVELRAERDAFFHIHPQPWSDHTYWDYFERFPRRAEEWLDVGEGSCVLGDPNIGTIMAKSLLFFDKKRYDLRSFVVMPNHVHVLFSLREGILLDKVIQSWKGYSSWVINQLLNSKGKLWQESYWDRMIRGEDHLAATMDYIRLNPIKAHLRLGEYIYWGE